MAQALKFLAGRRIPQPRGLVVTRGGELLAVGAEGHGINSVIMAQALKFLAGRRIPQPRSPVHHSRWRAACRRG